jgi:tetratricopeptide (TPR) repeat protein
LANPLGIFLSRLAPEEKRFIRRIGIFFVLLLILSVLALYLYVHFGREKLGHLDLVKKIDALGNLDVADIDNIDIHEFDTIEHIEPPEILPSEEQEHSEPAISNFDELAHLQLMRLNVSGYNYKLAYQHGNRIMNYLLSDPGLTAEWGRVLLEAGKPAEAVSALQKIISENSAKNETVIDMAFAMLRSGEADGAIGILDDKIRISNDLNLLAAKAAIIGEHPDTTKRAAADNIFKSALKKNPSLPNANYWYGRYLMQRGDFQSSKLHLERALKEKPNDPRYTARLGMAEFYLKQDSKAEALYKRALQINPYDYNTWYNLGELYLSEANESRYVDVVRKKTRQAMESYLKTIENDSLHANAHFRVGLILNGNSNYKEAIKHLSISLEKMPRHIPSMQQLSAAYMKLGDTTKSINYLNEILQIDPFNRIAASELKRLRE